MVLPTSRDKDRSGVGGPFLLGRVGAARNSDTVYLMPDSSGASLGVRLRVATLG